MRSFISHVLWCVIVGLNVRMYSTATTEACYCHMFAITLVSALIGSLITVALLPDSKPKPAPQDKKQTESPSFKY